MTGAALTPQLSEAEARPSAVKAWWTVAIFCVCAILSYTDRQILGLLVDPLRADLAISDTQVSLLQGLAFAIIYSFAGLPMGRLADMVSRRRLIMAGVVIWTAATVACGLVADFGQLFAARVFVGIGEAALAPAAISMIGDIFPPQRRGTALGIFAMGMIVGSGAALSVGGQLLQAAQDGWFQGWPIVGQRAPWRAVLLLLALPGVVMLLLLATIAEPIRHKRSWQGSGVPISAVFAGKRHLLLPLLAAMAFMSAGDFALLNWTPSLLARRFHEQPGLIGSQLGAIAMTAGALGALIGGWLSDRLGAIGGLTLRARTAALICLVAAPAATIAFWTTTGPIYVVFGLWVFASTCVGTMGIAAVQQSVPSEARGLTTAVNAFSNMTVGLGLGTMVTALITEHVFHDPLAVGKSLSLVTFFAACVGIISFLIASQRACEQNVKG
ncbi:MFS transporter [Stakelama pacifica]|uniref:Putative MFS family arabinose efflux permease n=1 Tax=Stakelama pacifica TaxID=517720 RepID=A0A4R6FCC9_9SPHN|nr:MFS transporter [Stakelama pacifica]TDN78260.1 putative MFS family arabinose efflux permease [Stakelama pacifica]GGO99776.1 MFS transporter [Stakelama pacifica]